MRLIDADALMEEVFDELGDGEVLYSIPPDRIDDAPTIDAEVVRHGQWISDIRAGKEYTKGVPLTYKDAQKHCSHPEINGYLMAVRCSVCGGDALANFVEEYEPSAYCPNCGAKMDAEVQDVD